MNSKSEVANRSHTPHCFRALIHLYVRDSSVLKIFPSPPLILKIFLKAKDAQERPSRAHGHCKSNEVVSQIKIEKKQSVSRKRCKTSQKLQILTSLTIHFSSKNTKYSKLYKPLKIKFLWLQFQDFYDFLRIFRFSLQFVKDCWFWVLFGVDILQAKVYARCSSKQALNCT